MLVVRSPCVARLSCPLALRPSGLWLLVRAACWWCGLLCRRGPVRVPGAAVPVSSRCFACGRWPGWVCRGLGVVFLLALARACALAVSPLSVRVCAALRPLAPPGGVCSGRVPLASWRVWASFASLLLPVRACGGLGWLLGVGARSPPAPVGGVCFSVRLFLLGFGGGLCAVFLPGSCSRPWFPRRWGLLPPEVRLRCNISLSLSTSQHAARRRHLC